MRYLPLLFVLSLIFVSCDNELNLTENKKETSVVFGFLNPSDTAQYIRVERAFIDPAISAFEIAKIPDSIYYTNLDVKLMRLSDSTIFQLEEVDGNAEGYVKQDGAFANEPNTLYKVRTEELGFLEDGEEMFELRIKRAESDTLITAQTVIVEKPHLTKPKDGSSLAFVALADTEIRWLEKESLDIYDVKVFINIKQQNFVTGGGFEDTTLVWNLANNVRDKEVAIPYQNFYTFLKSELVEDPNIRRRFTSLDVELFGAGEELDNYVNVLQANLGITSSQEIPTYTNMSQGLGIFSSRNIATSRDVRISPITLDSLFNGSITKNLNFE